MCMNWMCTSRQTATNMSFSKAVNPTKTTSGANLRPLVENWRCSLLWLFVTVWMRSRHSSENEVMRTDAQLPEIWKKFSFLSSGSDAWLRDQISGLKLSSRCRKSPELAGVSCDKICLYAVFSLATQVKSSVWGNAYQDGDIVLARAASAFQDGESGTALPSILPHRALWPTFSYTA